MRVDNRLISYSQLTAFAVVIVANAFGAGIAYWTVKADIMNIAERVAEIETYRVDRARSTDGNFADIRTKLEPLAGMQDAQLTNAAEIKATNQRIDRVVETFSDKFDQLIETSNEIKVNVGMLTTEVRNLRDEKRADAYHPPLIGPPLDTAAFK